MEISEPSPPADPAPLWRLAFRAGFLAAGTFAVVAMAGWLSWMTWPEVWDYRVAPHWWHAHELIFGFAMPVVAGFLLSAVATWTGIPGTRGWRLKLLFGLWLAARLLIVLSPGQWWLAWLAEMAFLLFLAYELTSRVWARRQWRNMLFPPILLVLALLDTASFLAMDDPLASTHLHYGAVWMVTLLVVIVGGRVTPLFTANRLGIRIAPLPAWFEALAIGITALIGLVSALAPAGPGTAWLSALCLAGAAIHLFRLAHWQGWRTARVPLLWSMHLSYLYIPLAMVGMAVAGDDPVLARNMIHLLAVGTIGGMILAMMSRVALGHTGRPLETPAYLAWAFALLLLAAPVRAVLPVLVPELTAWAWRLSAVMWMCAFACFLYRYWPVLTRPRADGKPG